MSEVTDDTRDTLRERVAREENTRHRASAEAAIEEKGSVGGSPESSARFGSGLDEVHPPSAHRPRGPILDHDG